MLYYRAVFYRCMYIFCKICTRYVLKNPRIQILRNWIERFIKVMVNIFTNKKFLFILLLIVILLRRYIMPTRNVITLNILVEIIGNNNFAPWWMSWKVETRRRYKVKIPVGLCCLCCPRTLQTTVTHTAILGTSCIFRWKKRDVPRPDIDKAKQVLKQMQKRLQASAGAVAVTVQCTVSCHPTPFLQHVFDSYLLTYSMEQSPSWEANWFCS